MWVRASKKNKNKKQNGKLFRDERRFGAKEKSENKHRKWKTERKIPTREFLLSWTQTNIVTIKSLLFCWSKIKFWSHFNHALCSIHGSIERGYKSHCHYFQRKQHLSSLSEHLRSRIFSLMSRKRALFNEIFYVRKCILSNWKSLRTYSHVHMNGSLIGQQDSSSPKSYVINTRCSHHNKATVHVAAGYSHRNSIYFEMALLACGNFYRHAFSCST